MLGMDSTSFCYLSIQTHIIALPQDKINPFLKKFLRDFRSGQCPLGSVDRDCQNFRQPLRQPVHLTPLFTQGRLWLVPPSPCPHLSRPEFLHKSAPVVKITRGEKVGKLSKTVASFYVNLGCISTTGPGCGKPLWKNLWRVWKTLSFQQVFRLFPLLPPPVEKSVYRFA